MPGYRVDGVSPIIKYSGNDKPQTGWAFATDGQKAAMTSRDAYYYTQAPSSKFSFEFYGSSVSVYGVSSCASELRVNGVRVAQSGKKNGLVLKSPQTKPGQHQAEVQVKCAKSGKERFNFGYLNVEGWLGKTEEVNLRGLTTNENDPSLTYHGNWVVRENVKDRYYYGASHRYTKTQGSSVSIPFTDQGVAVYGSLQTHYSPYTVQVKGGPWNGTRTYESSKSKTNRGGALLFFQGGFKAGKQHSLKLTNGVGSLDIDYVEFWTMANHSEIERRQLSPSISNLFLAAESLSPANIGSKQVNVPAILGGVFGGIVGVGLVAVLLVLFYSCVRPLKAERFMRSTISTDHDARATKPRPSTATVYPATPAESTGKKSRSSYVPSPVLDYNGQTRLSSSSYSPLEKPASVAEKRMSVASEKSGLSDLPVMRMLSSPVVPPSVMEEVASAVNPSIHESTTEASQPTVENSKQVEIENEKVEV